MSSWRRRGVAAEGVANLGPTAAKEVAEGVVVAKEVVKVTYRSYLDLGLACVLSKAWWMAKSFACLSTVGKRVGLERIAKSGTSVMRQSRTDLRAGRQITRSRSTP